jgi:septal ring factor EnvC (AmiA/AmiB activator)|tara:strand:- start:1019 stop:1255 length:237 start_codon:yes stop_codon:yes gene_type:complete
MAKTIDEKVLMEERKTLEDDYKSTEEKIKLIEKELINLKSNLNAIYGAVQQVDKLIVMSKEGNKSKSRQEADKASEVA